ncbi:MAG: hypothetical protein ACJAQ2_000574 [Vicingaceae bacterium]|jgi:hypothetical protein
MELLRIKRKKRDQRIRRSATVLLLVMWWNPLSQKMGKSTISLVKSSYLTVSLLFRFNLNNNHEE